MNKIIFNEGGQPVFLDDLEVIQENSWTMFKALLKSLTSSAGGYLLNPYSFSASSIEGESGTVLLTIPPNSVVYQGEIVPFESASFTNREIEAKGGVKVCVKNVFSDLRTFEDGQQHYCRSNVRAYLSLDESGADASYVITEMKSLPELLAYRIGYDNSDVVWHDIPVIFYNGYSGTLQFNDENLQVKISVRSSEKEWSTEVAPGSICRIIDSALVNKLSKPRRYFGLMQVPVNQDGEILGYGSLLGIDNEGIVSIENRRNDGSMGRGYIPPCGSEDEYAEIRAIF